MENIPATRLKKDAGNLNLLAVFHYVVAGIGFLFACFPLIHLAVGLFMLNGPVAKSRIIPRQRFDKFIVFRVAIRNSEIVRNLLG